MVRDISNTCMLTRLAVNVVFVAVSFAEYVWSFTESKLACSSKSRRHLSLTNGFIKGIGETFSSKSYVRDVCMCECSNMLFERVSSAHISIGSVRVLRAILFLICDS